jgi:guanine nucleotide-binding protein alpha-1 subunit
LLIEVDLVSILEAIAPPEESFPLADDSAQFTDEDLLGGASLGQASIIITAESTISNSSARVPQFDQYRRRLQPLLSLEDKLMRALASPDETEDDATVTHADMSDLTSNGGGPPPSPSWGWGRHTTPPWEAEQQQMAGGPMVPLTLRVGDLHAGLASPVAPSPSSSMGSSAASSTATRTRAGELLLSQRSNWKKAFAFGGRLRAQSPKSVHTNEIEGWWEDPEDPVHVLNASASVMEQLWHDPAVRKCLQDRRLRLEESSGL